MSWIRFSTYAKGEDGTVQHRDVQGHPPQPLILVPDRVGIVCADKLNAPVDSYCDSLEIAENPPTMLFDVDGSDVSGR